MKARRVRLTKAERAELLRQQGGLCVVWGCTESRNLIEEHSTPFVWTGQKADQLMCPEHHKEKTAKIDAPRIAKVNRIRKRAAGKMKPKRKIRSRGFDKTKRKHMDGRVTSR